MTDEEIVERIAQGEDSRTQFKLGPIGVAKLAAELAAFSNAGGGVILFGVGDEGEVVGLDAAAKKLLNDELSNAANDNVRPSVYPQTEYHTIGGKQILCVTVAEGVSKPYADCNVPINVPVKGHDETINGGNEAINQPNEVVNDTSEVVNNAPEVVKEVSEVVKEISEVVIEVVKCNPGIRKPHLMPLVSKSRATVERALANLMAKGMIEFRGAPKNGGYYIIESTEK